MDLTNLKKLISEKVSCYQDVEIDNNILVHGGRDTCEKRWEMLEPHLNDNSVIMDIGSDLGYFVQRIAQRFKKSLVLSFEQTPSSCEIQKEIYKQLKLYNALVFCYKFWIETLQRLSQAVEMIDTILFLAVLHHYSEKEQRQVLKLCSSMIPEIIIEYIVQIGNGAWGGVAYLDFEKVLPDYYSHVEVIGISHDGPSERRVLIKAWNNSFEREGLNPTMFDKYDLSNSIPNHKIIYKDGVWELRSKTKTDENVYPKVHDDFVKGVSLYNLLFLKPVWPVSVWFQEQAKKAYTDLLDKNIEISNIHLPNLIFTADGLKAIEFVNCSGNFDRPTADKCIQDIVEVLKQMNLN